MRTFLFGLALMAQSVSVHAGEPPRLDQLSSCFERLVNPQGGGLLSRPRMPEIKTPNNSRIHSLPVDGDKLYLFDSFTGGGLLVTVPKTAADRASHQYEVAITKGQSVKLAFFEPQAMSGEFGSGVTVAQLSPENPKPSKTLNPKYLSEKESYASLKKGLKARIENLSFSYQANLIFNDPKHYVNDKKRYIVELSVCRESVKGDAELESAIDAQLAAFGYVKPDLGEPQPKAGQTEGFDFVTPKSDMGETGKSNLQKNLEELNGVKKVLEEAYPNNSKGQQKNDGAKQKTKAN